MESINAQGHTDVKTDGFLIRLLPASARPYAHLMRLDRPIGTWLLLLPAWWAIALGWAVTRDAQGALWTVFLFAIGAVIMRGAGCVINDLWDRDFDGKVERTRTRPIPSGTITVKQAKIFLAVLMAIGLVILLQFNWLTVALGILSLPLIVAYPLMKRITWWPQAFLGITFNWGALMGWAAVTDTLTLTPILLYIAGFFWTLGYDTIYAHMDKDDDALIGIKSSAQVLKGDTKKYLLLFYALTTLFLMLAALDLGMSIALWPAMFPVMAVFLVQIRTVNIDDPASCLRVFRANRDQGLIILLALLAHAATLH